MAVSFFALDSRKRKCFIINYSCLPFGCSAAGGAVALTVLLAFGVPGSSGVVSMAVPLASFIGFFWRCLGAVHLVGFLPVH